MSPSRFWSSRAIWLATYVEREIELRRLAALTALFALAAGFAMAQTPAPAAKPAPAPAAKRSHSISGTPLDALRQTHLWADTGPAKDFVKDSRPSAGSLDYAPLTGTDPERPKPRDTANIAALQAELERDRVVNEGKGHKLGPLKPAKKASR